MQSEPVNAFFEKATQTEINVTSEFGSDYSLFIPFEDDHDLTKDDHESLTDDPEEAKLDYWREDSLFHSFHVNFHKIWDVYAFDESSNRFERTFELFFYTHQQMVRR